MFAPTYKVFSPFNPTGVDSTAAAAVTDEKNFQSAFTFHFTEWLILVEGDLAAAVTYQEGDFVGEYFGTPPTGDHQAGTLLWIDKLIDGHVTENYGAWDQQGFMQKMGWQTVDYPDFTVKPWGIKLGTTTSTPSEHHKVLTTLYDSFCVGCEPEYKAAYKDQVVVHDYTTNLNGLNKVSNQLKRFASLPELKQDTSLSVCEGDLCVSYLIFSFAGKEGPQPLIWAAVHRFESGKIAEEWWQYDNAVLWPATDWLKE